MCCIYFKRLLDVQYVPVRSTATWKTMSIAQMTTSGSPLEIVMENDEDGLENLATLHGAARRSSGNGVAVLEYQR